MRAGRKARGPNSSRLTTTSVEGKCLPSFSRRRQALGRSRSACRATSRVHSPRRAPSISASAARRLGARVRVRVRVIVRVRVRVKVRVRVRVRVRVIVRVRIRVGIGATTRVGVRVG